MTSPRPLALSLAALLTACGGGGGGPGDGGAPDGGPDAGWPDAGYIDTGPGSAPVLSGAVLAPAEVVQGDGNGTASPLLSVTFADPDGDLVAIMVATVDRVQVSPLGGVAGVTSGTLRWPLQLPTSAVGQTVLQVAVRDARGHVSNPLEVLFQVDAPAPQLFSLSPLSAVAGGPGFTLTVSGQGFVDGGTVYWNGSARPTVAVAPGRLEAAIGAQDIAGPGVAEVTVAGPTGLGAPSPALTFGIGAVGTLVVDEPVNDLAYDARRGRLYASVASGGGARGNAILVVEPDGGAVLDAVFVGSEPSRLALSDDGAYLYVALDGSHEVKRLALPSLAPDLAIPLGQALAVDLQVAPGAPRTLAVSLGFTTLGPLQATGGVVVYDDAVARAQAVDGTLGTFDTLQWTADAGALLAADGETSGHDYYVLPVSPAGVSLGLDLPGTFDHYDTVLQLEPVSGRLYSSSGQVLEPFTGRILGTYPTAGPMAPVPALNAAFFLGAGSGTPASLLLSAFNLTRFTPFDTATVPLLPGVPPVPSRVVRYGSDGLAAAGGGYPLLLMRGPFLGTPVP